VITSRQGFIFKNDAVQNDTFRLDLNLCTCIEKNTSAGAIKGLGLGLERAIEIEIPRKEREREQMDG
jgi:hypothetical protein